MIFGGYNDFIIILSVILYLVLFDGTSGLQLASVVPELDAYLGVGNCMGGPVDCLSIPREPTLYPVYGPDFSKCIPWHAMA